jgi:MFS family permease
VTRDFVRLLAAATISNFGSMLTALALPLLAISVLDASPAQIAALNAAAILPGLLIGLFAAQAVDRLRRRRVLITADLVRALLLLTLPLAWFEGVLTMTHVVAFAFCRGAFDFAFDVAEQAYLPSLVPAGELVRANGRLQAGDSSAEAAGFALGGWLVQWLSAPLALLVDSASYLASAALLLRIGAGEPEPEKPRAGARRLAELFAGVAEVWRTPPLRALAVSSMWTAAGGQVVGTVYLLFVYRELGFAPGVLGVLFALGAVSSLSSALLADRVPQTLEGRPVIVTGLALYALGPLLLSLAPGANLWGAAAIASQQLVADGGYVLYEVHQGSLRQRITPSRLLGRVTGSIRLLNSGAMLVGLALGGWLGDVLGLRPTLFVAAGLELLGALSALAVRSEVVAEPELERE